VKCWAFEPPGGLMTRTVSRALQPICTSTALGKDLVPRLGIATFERLREDMVRAGRV
jgi:sn1-specific diacylglycerol lipase